VENPSRGTRRRYDNSSRTEKAAHTRTQIVTAAVELVHEFESWDWRELTYRAVAARAGVGERTVYRHFPTERQLHDEVMKQLEEEAGITYEDVDLTNIGEVTGRVFGSLQRFAVRDSVRTPADDPTFATVDIRRRRALVDAVADATPGWSDRERAAAAGLLDVLWNLPTYERLVGPWGLAGHDATQAVTWLMDKVLETIAAGRPPGT
jgi:AcrR family transcriptional regulator